MKFQLLQQGPTYVVRERIRTRHVLTAFPAQVMFFFAERKAKKLITNVLQQHHAKQYMRMIIYRCTKFSMKLQDRYRDFKQNQNDRMEILKLIIKRHLDASAAAEAA